jgi:hypothetical protein
MAASKNSETVKITPVSAEDIAEAVAASAPPSNLKIEEMAGGTIRESNTKYEDRTFNPVDDAATEYEKVVEELGDGTVITTYMDPVGGFAEAE